MTNIDITVDLETLGLSPNAAIVQVGAVAWKRDAEKDPFKELDVSDFQGDVDLRSCLLNGFDIEADTVKWWKDKSPELKDSVFGRVGVQLHVVLDEFAEWILEVQTATKATSVSLWAHGTDFDLCILKNAFAHYGMKFPVHHHGFRDSRTFIMEVGGRVFFPGGAKRNETIEPKDIYAGIPSVDGLIDFPAMRHNALYDAYRTSYQVWWLMRQLNNAEFYDEIKSR